MFFVSDNQTRATVTIEPIIEAVEAAFRALAEDRSELFPVSRGSGSSPGHFVAIKSCREGSTGLLGLKVGSYRPANRSSGLHAHGSTVLTLDDNTGFAIATVQADHLNGLRTAAAGACAAKALAPASTSTLSVLGTGAQAVFEVEALRKVRDIRDVFAYARISASAERFAVAVRKRVGIDVQFAPLREVVERADILVTATPATGPLFDADWVRPGTHISAIGSDNVGKQELPTELFTRATLYMDHPPQAMMIGEAQHVLAEGIATADDLLPRSIGAVLIGRMPGRRTADEITIFDSTGLAVQDVAAASRTMDIIYPGWRAASRKDHNREGVQSI